MEKAINQILQQTAKLYDRYDQRTAAMSQQNRKKMGAQNDQKEKLMMQNITRLQTKMANLLGDMDKSAAMKNAQLRDCPRLVRQCLQDIQSITKKKNLLFKVNASLEDLLTSTNQQADLIKKDLGIAGQTKFLCCGTDGIAKFKNTFERFKLSHAKWSLLSRLQPKDSVQTFISPRFQVRDYAFIREVLRRAWPQDLPVKVEVKQVVKEVIKQVNTGKPSRLVQANQYIYGINRQINPSYGLKIYHQQADKNNDSIACAFLGQVYEQGVLLPKDLRKAVNYYKKAMDGKQPYAFYRYAMALIKGQLLQKQATREDIQMGFQLLNKAANFPTNPSAEALIQLGELYQKGSFETDTNKLFSVPVDTKKAIDCYMKARSMNVPRASNNLGVLYINSKSISQSNPNSRINIDDANSNIDKGMKYLQEAEFLGFPQAFYNIGFIYENGITGRKNLQQALVNYYKGGLKGDMQSRLKFAYQLMNQTSIMKQQYQDHYRIAFRWLQNIVHKVDILQQNTPSNSQIKSTHTISQKAQALFYIGLMYQYGFGVDKSPKKAFSYFIQSSQLDYPAAKNKIGDCYFSGFGVRQDRKVAIGCYQDAARLNNSDAEVNLGTIYLNGIPNLVQRNYQKAYQHFFTAMKAENSNAMIHLSYMYKNGLGLQNQRSMALKLLQQSAINKNPIALYMLKEMGGPYDQKILLNNPDNDFYATPRKININQICPYISKVQ